MVKKNINESTSSCNRKTRRSMKEFRKGLRESFEGEHSIAYIEPDGDVYSDPYSGFTVEEYYDEETDEILGWTWSSPDDFEPTQPYFDTAEEAYRDAEYVLTPDDGSKLVIDGDFDEEFEEEPDEDFDFE